ncbi:hypothetical protein [Streptomyces sp. NPDC005303]|uniref:hypothetical protein n=1 Tax=Streptomyces sp. NPDC005303 TaxID=3155713 RepID=UPI0033BA6891
MPELIAPTGRLQSSWLAARDEWPPGAHQDGTGLRLALDADLERPAVFLEQTGGVQARRPPHRHLGIASPSSITSTMQPIRIPIKMPAIAM